MRMTFAHGQKGEPMLKDEILKLQTYKLFEGDTDVYVNRDEVLKLATVAKKETVQCEGCIHQTGRQINCLGCARKAPDRYTRGENIEGYERR